MSPPSAQTGNLTVDPGFRSYDATAPFESWDLTYASGSPLIDAGDPDVLDVDGTRSDLGAYGGPAPVDPP